MGILVKGEMAKYWKSLMAATYPKEKIRFILFRSLIFLAACISLPAVAQLSLGGQTCLPLASHCALHESGNLRYGEEAAMSYRPNNINLTSSSTFGWSGKFYRDPDFWLATTVNLSGIGLFLTRVHAPGASKWFGYCTQLLSIPALVLAVADITNGSTDFATWSNMGYAAWSLFSVTIDHILKVEYRNPFKPGIIIPYVTAYYASIGCMSAAQYNNGYVPWIVAGFTCVINVGTSFYARLKGADR